MTGDKYRTAGGITIPDMHPDDVREAAGALLLYLGIRDQSPDEVADAVALAIQVWQCCDERRQISERAAIKRAAIVRRVRGQFPENDMVICGIDGCTRAPGGHAHEGHERRDMWVEPNISQHHRGLS